MKAIFDLGRKFLRIGDLGHVEIPLRESRGGHVKIVLKKKSMFGGEPRTGSPGKKNGIKRAKDCICNLGIAQRDN